MNARELLSAIGEYEIRGDADIEIVQISFDSRLVSPGSLFVAISGTSLDGRQYVEKAVALGASAVVFEGEFFDKLRALQIRVSGARLALARLSAEFFGHPTKTLYLAGVTGTNGKTTLTYLLEALWQEAGLQTGVIGTVSTRFAETVKSASQTTPESLDLQETFSEMAKTGVTHAAIEVSSHAAAQGRIRECHFDSCVFTNLTQDHLDYHQTMEDYYSAKEKVFTDFLIASEKSEKLAIISQVDSYGKTLAHRVRRLGLKGVTYGLEDNCDIYPKKYSITLEGLDADIETPWGFVKVQTPLSGRFNLLNVMAAIAVGLHSGLKHSVIEEALLKFRQVPGRLERINDPNGRLVFVDYAHTPDALKNVLTMLSESSPNRLITVFGCGGDRDPAKRPLMGFEAASFSDVCFVTSDNPRTEEAHKIIEQIIPGLEKGGMKKFDGSCGYLIVSDRRQAIAEALSLARCGDVVLVAGKGHEDYQILGSEKFHFSDQEEIRLWLDCHP